MVLPAATTADFLYNDSRYCDMIPSKIKNFKMDARTVNSYVAKSTIILVSSYAVATLVGIFIPSISEQLISLKFSLPYWSTVIGLLIFFVISSFFELDTKMQIISERTMPHLEIYQNARDFHVRMSQFNEVATSILATNFSYPPDQKKTGPLIDYYKDLHELIRRPDSTLENFRVIVNVCDASKAKWVIDRAASFAGHDRFSMAITDLQHVEPLQCIHIIVTKSGKYTFFFPPIPKHDYMRSFMIVDEKLADLLISQFEQAWVLHRKIIDGGILDQTIIEALKSKWTAVENAPVAQASTSHSTS